MRRRAAVALAFLAGAAGAGRAEGDGGRKSPRPVSLREARIGDRPTRVSVPVSADVSLVMGLPEHFWIQCPRNVQAVATSLDGDGLVLQYIEEIAKGGTHALLYLGAVPLGAASAGEAPEARVRRAAQEFVLGLREKYARVEFALKTDPQKIAVDKALVKVDGRTRPAWRTSRYDTTPSGSFSGPDPSFVGECLLFHVADTDSLVYVALDAKRAGTSLDRLLDDFSVQKTGAVNKAGNVVQLNDVAEGTDSRFRLRLASFESPPGFVVSLGVLRMKEEAEYAEDRLDEKGAVTASYRLRQRGAVEGRSLAEEAEAERKALGLDAAAAQKAVDLSTPGARALVFSYRAKAEYRDVAARTAVLVLEDKVWTFTWTSFGSEAEARADETAFEALLKGMQVAVR